MAGNEESALGKAYDGRLVRRLLPFVRPHRALAVGTLALVSGQVLVEIVRPLIVKHAIDGPVTALAGNAADAEAWSGLFFVSMVFIAVLFVDLILRFFGELGLNDLGQRVIFDLRSRLYGHLQALPLGFYDRNPVGRLVTRVSSDIEAIGELFTSGLARILADIAKIVVILAIMVVMNWKLALTVVLFFPVMAAVTGWFRARARDAYREMRIKQASLNSFLNEAMGGASVTRVFAQEERQTRKYAALNAQYRSAALATVTSFAMFFPAVGFVSTAAGLMLLWYGSSLVMDNELAAGTFVAFVFYTDALFRPLREISERYATLQSAMASTERVIGILDEKVTLSDPEQPHPFDRAAFRGEIEFRNVWFAYKDEQWVLRDVSFRVAPGEALALVGATGSGKSTIINLMCRFYDVQRGEILIDGVDVRRYRQADLRSAIALVLQDVFLFAGSVADNVRLGDEGISRERVVAACRATGASEFIEGLEGGYDAKVAERGATFSTGQKQLLAFARALAFDTPILILDEATANIDSETEAAIQRALATLMRGRTTVAVAHRLSTIQHASQILVMHKGEVVERGTHEELLAIQGRYWRLYRLQFGDAAESGRQVAVA